MDDPSTNPEVAPSEEATRRGFSPGTTEARPDGTCHPRQVTTEPKRVEIVLRIVATGPQQTEPSKRISEAPAQPGSVPPTAPAPALTRPANTLSHSMDERKVAGREVEPQQIPARMLNEFVYCHRLFFYEFVEGVFVESTDTLRGSVLHQRVDSGNGALPAAKKKAKAEKKKVGEETTAPATVANTEPET